MINGFWGKKIGVTQVFSDEKKVVIPVTAIDISNWYITQVKTVENDGYSAIQLGLVKDKYSENEFSKDWLKKPKEYFNILKEVRIDDVSQEFEVGKKVDISEILSEGDNIDAFGVTKGAGFQGVVRRFGYAGGRASHGAKFGRFPGSLSFLRASGRVFKGKKMPGHMGVKRRVMKNLKIVKVEPDVKLLLVSGSVPGKSGSLVFLKKRV